MNPEFLAATVAGGPNAIPSFITADGHAREARFKFFLNRNGSLSNNPEGGVHDLSQVACGVVVHFHLLGSPDRFEDLNEIRRRDDLDAEAPDEFHRACVHT